MYFFKFRKESSKFSVITLSDKIPLRSRCNNGYVTINVGKVSDTSFIHGVKTVETSGKGH